MTNKYYGCSLKKQVIAVIVFRTKRSEYVCVPAFSFGDVRNC